MMMWYFPSIFYRLHGMVLSLHSWVDDRQKVGRKSSILLPRNVCDARSATNATTHPWKIRNHSKNLTLQIPNSSFWPRVAKHRGPRSVLVVVAVLQILLRKSFKTWFKLNFLAVSVFPNIQGVQTSFGWKYVFFKENHEIRILKLFAKMSSNWMGICTT